MMVLHPIDPGLSNSLPVERVAEERDVCDAIVKGDYPPSERKRLERDPAERGYQELIEDRMGVQHGPPELAFGHRRHPLDKIADLELLDQLERSFLVYAPIDAAQPKPTLAGSDNHLCRPEINV